MDLHLKKVQIYGCKQGLSFEKFRKVPLGKFPPEKNSPENISDNFVKFRKFFFRRETFRKISGKFTIKFHYKSYNLPAVNKCNIVLSPMCVKGCRKLPENFSDNFCHTTHLAQINL
jgi:hypothetical protein